MSRLRSLTPWKKLTRTGLPAFRVSRRPIVTLGQTFEIGALLPLDAVLSKTRFRQMYEQRYIEVASDEKASAQPHPKQQHRSVPVSVAIPPALPSLLPPVVVAVPVVESGGYTPRNKVKRLAATPPSRGSRSKR